MRHGCSGVTARDPSRRCDNLSADLRAIGAVVARFVHTEEVTGSNPVSPTGDTGRVLSRGPGLRHLPPFCVGVHHGAVAAQPDRAARLRAVVARDGDTCIWCGRPFAGLIPPTTEHVVPRLKGGPSWLENEGAACHRCNSERGHRGPVEWLEECLRRGWKPDEERLARSLT